MNKQATAIGFIAVFLWSSLALFTSQVSAVPPLLSLSITLGMSSIMLLIVYFVRGELQLSWRATSRQSMILGGGSYFFYHFLYFYALQNAPNILAGMLSYSWPLLLILAICFQKRVFHWGHIVGGSLAFLGTGVMLHSGSQMSTVIDTTTQFSDAKTTTLGHFAAIGASLVWGGYTLLNRRFTTTPSSSVLWNCIIASILALIAHLMFEPIVWSFSQETWIAMLGLGFGPIGIAFLCWDIGIKRGNLSFLSVLCYSAPVFSLFWTVLFSRQTLDQEQVIASALVILGIITALYLSPRKNVNLPSIQPTVKASRGCHTNPKVSK